MVKKRQTTTTTRIQENDNQHQALIDNDTPPAVGYLPPIETLQADSLFLDSSALAPFEDAIKRMTGGDQPAASPKPASNAMWDDLLTAGNADSPLSPLLTDHRRTQPPPPAPAVKRKRGRPKSQRPANHPKQPHVRSPNLYSVLVQSQQLSGYGDPYSSLHGQHPTMEGVDPYAWMREKRGKRRRAPALLMMQPVPAFADAVGGGDDRQHMSAPMPSLTIQDPVLDSITSNPALMQSLGMRPVNATPSLSPLTLSTPVLGADGIALQSATTSSQTDNQQNQKDNTPPEKPISQFEMDELFDELLR